jgi:SnoaL-like domain
VGKRSTFREGVEANDLDVMMSAFADDAVLYNPFYNQAFEGSDLVRMVLGNVMEVFEDFSYVSELADDRGTVGLIFRAKVGKYDIQGLDLVQFNADDEIVQFTVMVRPEKAASELHKQMVERMTRALDRS